MLKIDEFQKLFVASVTSGQREGKLLSQLEAVGSLTIDEVMDVYRGDYKARLSEAIGESLEATWAVVGDDSFFELVSQYLNEFPSNREDLGQIARNMPMFLTNYYLIKEYPFLIDLVEFELSFWDTFHKRSPLNYEIDLNLSMDDLLSAKISLCESIKLFTWDTSIYSIWCLRDEGFHDYTMSEFDRPQSVAIYKTSQNVRISELTKSQFNILNGMMKKMRLEDILDHIPVSAPDLQELFSMLQQNSLIKRIL